MPEPSPSPDVQPAGTGTTGALPTSAQLDELEADLERIDAVLARLDEET